MTECNAIIEANNEIDRLKKENKKLNALCVQYGFEMGRLEGENEQLKSTLHYLLNVIQNKCSKYYPKCKEIVRNCFENDFNNTENDGDEE